MSESKGKILVVDDMPDLARTVQIVLEQAGYEAILAADGQEGLDKAQAEQPDLIVLDVMMPVLDGFAVCRKLRKDPQLKDTPVILLTGVGEHAAATDYPVDGVLQADADDYIEKPVDPKALVAAIARLLD